MEQLLPEVNAQILAKTDIDTLRDLYGQDALYNALLSQRSVIEVMRSVNDIRSPCADFPEYHVQYFLKYRPSDSILPTKIKVKTALANNDSVALQNLKLSEERLLRMVKTDDVCNCMRDGKMEIVEYLSTFPSFSFYIQAYQGMTDPNIIRVFNSQVDDSALANLPDVIFCLAAGNHTGKALYVIEEYYRLEDDPDLVATATHFNDALFHGLIWRYVPYHECLQLIDEYSKMSMKYLDGFEISELRSMMFDDYCTALVRVDDMDTIQQLLNDGLVTWDTVADCAKINIEASAVWQALDYKPYGMRLSSTEILSLIDIGTYNNATGFLKALRDRNKPIPIGVVKRLAMREDVDALRYLFDNNAIDKTKLRTQYNSHQIPLKNGLVRILVEKYLFP